jgi:DNA polymerase-1
MPLCNALIDIEEVGTIIDINKIEEVAKATHTHHDHIDQQLKEAAGETFNYRSAIQLRSIIYDKLSLPVINTTETGLASTDRETLEMLSEVAPDDGSRQFIDAIVRLRQLDKDTQYCEGNKSIRALVKEDGRVHTDYHVGMTVTGRLSSSDPNLQNIPRESPIRQAFTVPVGYKFVESDYSQVELRIQAWYSKDEALLNAFARGEDIHDSIAQRIYNTSHVSKQQRVETKMIIFGIMYGRGPVSVARQLRRPEDYGVQLFGRLYEEFPRLKEWQDRVRESCSTLGIVSTVFGRTRHLPGMLESTTTGEQKAEWVRQGVAFQIQSTAADCLSRATVRVHERLKDLKSVILMTLHDALFLEVSEDELDEVCKIVKEEMERPVPELDGLLLPVNITVGDCWEDIHSYTWKSG